MKAYINPYILRLIEEAITDEMTGYKQYLALARLYPQRAALFEGIAADELKHYKMLRELYEELSGKEYTPKENLPMEDSSAFMAGMTERARDNAAMYRTLYFALPKGADKNTLFEIMTDEIMQMAAVGYLDCCMQ